MGDFVHRPQKLACGQKRSREKGDARDTTYPFVFFLFFYGPPPSMINRSALIFPHVQLAFSATKTKSVQHTSRRLWTNDGARPRRMDDGTRMRPLPGRMATETQRYV